jgi:hypothetical protein
MEMDTVGALRLAAGDIRDGVPDLVMSLAVSRDTAERLIANQRRLMRDTRDQQVLWGAAQKYIEAHPGQTPDDIAELKPYLHGEPLTEGYKISETAAWDSAEDMYSAFVPANESQDDEFSAAVYTVTLNGRLLDYIPPPVNDNDIAYRLEGDVEKVDRAALKTGRFRLAAYIDETNNRLLVATDAEAMASFLALQERLPQRGTPPATTARSKVAITGSPKYLIDQGLLYPEGKVKQFVTDYLLDFDQYRQLHASVEPLPTQLGIIATVVFSHE